MTDSLTEDEKSLRTLVFVIYGLYILAPLTGFSAVIGVIIAHIKHRKASGTIFESHFSNQIKIFWIPLFTLELVFLLFIFSIFSVGLFVDFNSNNPSMINDILQSMFLIGITIFPIIIIIPSVILFVWAIYRIVRGFILAVYNKSYYNITMPQKRDV